MTTQILKFWQFLQHSLWKILFNFGHFSYLDSFKDSPRRLENSVSWTRHRVESKLPKKQTVAHPLKLIECISTIYQVHTTRKLTSTHCTWRLIQRLTLARSHFSMINGMIITLPSNHAITLPSGNLQVGRLVRVFPIQRQCYTNHTLQEVCIFFV